MSFPSSRNGKLTVSAEVVQALFENGKSPLSAPFLRWKLWKRWPELVGPTIAGVSEPVAFRDGTLSVWVKNAAWMQQLVFMRDQMKVTLNQKLGENLVQSILLTLDRRSVPADPAERERLEQTVQSIIKQNR